MLTRRHVLGGLASVSASLIGCGDGEPAANGSCRDAAPAPLQGEVVCGEGSFDALVGELIEAPIADTFDRAAAHLRGGVTLSTLLAAGFHAGIRALAPSLSAFNHSIMAVPSVNLIGAAVDPRLQLAAVLWALQGVKGEQALQANSPQYQPLPPLDERGVATRASAARQLLIDGLDAFDGDAADLGAASMFRRSERSDLVDVLLRYAARNFAEEHRPIFTEQCFRALDAFGWSSAEPVVRAIARVLAEGKAGGEGMVTFASSVELAETGIDLGGTSCELGRVLELLAAGRTLESAALRDEMAAALAGGLCVEAAWDGLLAAGAEVVLRGNGGGGLHCFDAMNALRSATARASTPELKALMLLQAAASIPHSRNAAKSFMYPPPFREIDIDTLEPGTAPAALEALFERGGGGRGDVDDVSPVQDALAWFEAGGSACEYLTRARELVVQKGIGDQHFCKFPAAVFEEVGRVDAFWVPRLLATELLVNASPTRHDDWVHLDEALALGAELAPSYMTVRKGG